MSQGLGRKFDAAQRAYDNRMPEEESPAEKCTRCKKWFNRDTQELDPGKQCWCDDCVRAVEAENNEDEECNEKPKQE